MTNDVTDDDCLLQERAADELVQLLREMINMLNTRDKRIIEMRCGLNDGIEHTYVDIGKAFGITGERAREIVQNIMRKLRYKSDRLRDVL